MVRKIKNTGNNVPEIVFSLVTPEEQGQNSSTQHSKNNKSHKKRKNREQEQNKRNNLPTIIITDLSDDVQDKGLTNSNSNLNKKFPKNIINIEDNEIISTNHDFVDFEHTFNENQNISNGSSNNFNIKQQKKGESIKNKNLLLNNSSSKNLKANQLWKFLKRKFLIKGYDLQSIN
ncbi:unnamed protein product [Rhizophagus irregularis]|nr:unnamed protein product [Rhizophagus irregularis]CAB5374156.1 unnamed protein product [Rhizophagus irregularis]